MLTFFTILAWGGAAVPVLFVISALRPVTTRQLTKHSKRYRQRMLIESPAFLQAIARSRGMSLLGVAVGFSVPPLVQVLTHSAERHDDLYLGAAAGYLVGALLAALVPITRFGGPLRSAALVPRRLGDYVPVVMQAMFGMSVVLCALIAAAFVVTRRPDTEVASLVGWVVLSAVATAVAIGAARLIVRRPQPVAEPEVLAIDDAVRAYGLYQVLLAGSMAAVAGLAGASFELGSATSVGLVEELCANVVPLSLGLVFLGFGLRRQNWSAPKAHL